MSSKEDEELSLYELDTAIEQYQENENQEFFAQVVENTSACYVHYNVTLPHNKEIDHENPKIKEHD